MVMQEVTTLLREKGFKVTPQRLAVYDVLCHTTAHPTADMIYSELQPTYPTMSLATVYKTLDILGKVGLVQALNVGEESFRYDANTTSHPHICCVGCGRVDDVFKADTGDLVEQVETETGYAISGKQLYFYGQCPACQKAAH
ncbi:Fur family transcriptional regulator [Selenomonas sputigena]|uniref:Fur family transcriptional regulator n=1 Tax=Selenomonas sputigena TaxID=69823 RepID=A0ABV3X6Q4_9FIRM